MPYTPLHLKYRPQRFADVVGQTAVVKTLTNAIRLNRIAPAYLFCGPRGTGKTSSARILAKSLNCVQGPTPDPCNVCAQCQAITQGSSLDVIEIDAASNTGVDNIRELIERAQFAPVSSTYKVYVLDEVHMLSGAAFNALLKTLEEPPPHVVFILATTDPQRVLPTVISRCQRFDYRRIPLEDMVEHLAQIAGKEGIRITTEALHLIGQLSQGGLRDAESLLDQLSLLEGEISLESVWNLVGSVPERQLLALLEAIQAESVEAVLTQVRQLLDQGKEPLMVLQNLAALGRDLLLAKTAPTRQDLVTLTSATWKALQQNAQPYPLDKLLALQKHLRQAEPLIRQTPQPRLWLEITLVEMLALLSQKKGSFMDPPIPLQAADSGVAAVNSHPPITQPTPIPTPVSHSLTPEVVKSDLPPTPHIPTSEPVLRGSTLQDLWEEVRKELSPRTKGLFRAGKVIQETDKEVVIGFTIQDYVKKAQAALPEVQPLVNKLLKRPVQIKFIVRPPQEDAVTPPPTISPQPLDPVLVQKIPEQQSQTKASPPQTELVSPIWASDELQRVAHQFADFFNGSVIETDKDSLPSPQGVDPEEELPF